MTVGQGGACASAERAAAIDGLKVAGSHSASRLSHGSAEGTIYLGGCGTVVVYYIPIRGRGIEETAAVRLCPCCCGAIMGQGRGTTGGGTIPIKRLGASISYISYM